MVSIYKAKTKPSRIGNIINLSIDSTDYEVQGIAKIDNKIAFVTGALAGEKVQAKVLEDKAGFIKASVTSVKQAVPERVNAPCRYAKQCGGCQLQYIAVSDQQRLKQLGIDDLLSHQLGLTDLPWQPMLAADNIAYRRRARIGVWYDKKQRKFSIGFRQANAKQIVNIQHCLVLSPVLAPVFTVLATQLPLLSTNSAVTHVEVIDAAGQAYIIVRHTQPLTLQDKQRLIDAWPTAIWLGEFESGQFSPWQPEHAQYQAEYSLPEQGLRLQFGLDNFIQVNAAVNQEMVSQALQWLAPTATDTILDLYAGIGNFSLALAQQVKAVHAVEGIDKMVQQLLHNAKVNQLSNVTASQADLHLPWPKASWNTAQYNKVLLDPARAGAHGAIEQVVKLKPKTILYVSCNAATLARDSKVLLDSGYRLEKLSGIDMFPHTRHLELMALFSK
ncbi:23S rRNA (uracil(1939)-C(5))-methyltransferase RlmD [Rheinheimera salexigens]|uniref:23S rRNA (Uracil(1939)-C(5))-methyltransferase n=1 Tax=Rheinheimera salexigens TaxID=1628148 RepID=A0A1E7Q4P9_9GAMM|nr:23S rRNA (uracil(1939)-C(5))-methyltransferase RlmD [Rheinheimera salexigens]OEY69129.1 23S rRNA (uracil(1939)-C(5))-methyltransferase [Rheinheimera salexigens]